VLVVPRGLLSLSLPQSLSSSWSSLTI
jgi:hypothetical protein